MQRGTDGPKNTLNELVRIRIKFYSQMSVAYAFNLTIFGDVFGGSLVGVKVSDTLSSKCSKAVFWGGIMWGRRTPLVVMEGAETAIRYRNDILRPILQSCRQNFERN